VQQLLMHKVSFVDLFYLSLSLSVSLSLFLFLSLSLSPSLFFQLLTRKAIVVLDESTAHRLLLWVSFE